VNLYPNPCRAPDPAVSLVAGREKPVAAEISPRTTPGVAALDAFTSPQRSMITWERPHTTLQWTAINQLGMQESERVEDGKTHIDASSTRA
jgi:hypothetical protein